MESDIKKSYILVLFFTTIVSRILGSELQSEFAVPLELSVTRDVKSTVLGYVTYELTGLVGCAKICFQKPECQSFTHSKSTLQCELYDHSLQSNELRTLKKSVYSEKINWNQNLFSDCGQLSCSLGSSCFNRGNNSTCIPTECGPIPLVANGELNLAYETRVGTLAEYTCDPGTVLEGRPERRCLTTGEWQPDLFKCHLQCPPTPVVPDAALDDPLRIVGIYTNYTCVNNTVLFGTPQLYCQENQTWTPVQFECIRQCPPAPDVNDATINTTDTIINTTVGYQCHPRADTFGTPNIVCQEDLSWSPVIFNCSRQCPVSEEVTHARKLSHIRQVFTTLEYECINDTLLDGDPTRFCPTTQIWEPILFTCIEQCPVLDIPHAINDTTSRVLSSVVNYHCADGYLHNGTTQITCQNDRNWTPIDFECIEVCPTEAPTVQYANTDQTLRFVETVASYTCDPDTIIHGDNYVTCIYSTNSTLDWSAVPFWCEKVCPDSPPMVMDGTLNNYNRSIGALAEYICHNETVLIDGPATIPCLQSQQWGAQTFDCRRQCSIPPVYPNSIVNPGPRTLGETITYNCTAGHMLKSGTLSIFCQNNQEWTDRDFDCFPICVESPPTVPDGVLSNTDRFVGDVAIYSCINDTVLMNGPAQVECQSDQTWASPIFDCRRQCPVPPSLDNGESIPGPRTLGETISYQCNHLFIMEGTPDIFCMANQTWTSITFYCRPICPDPPVVADSSIITFDNSINGTADYQCDNETVLLGGLPILTCLPSQTWSTTHFECRRQCAVPDPQPNTEPITVPARTIGTILNYTCITQHDVYPLTETPQIICQDNQQWLISFQCTPVCTDSPPTIPDGVLTNTDRFVGDVAIYSCINDTVLMNGPAQVECQSDQTWASPIFDCRRQCPVPPSLDDGESIPGPRTLGETISYQCNDLFIMEGIPDIFCMSNQTWTSIAFYCRPICPDPPVVADSSIIIFNNSINGTADYQCDNETVLLGGLPILTCLPSQTWSIIHFECRRQCAVPDPQPNTEPITVPARTIGTILNYTCITQHDVYPLTETPQIICQDNQQWLISFQCKPVCVESPPVVPDGNLTTTDRFVGDVAIYSCINDTVLMNGPAQVACQSNQTWASPTFDCRRKCPVPPGLDDGESIPGPRTLGETISYQCNHLFIMEGTPDIFCMSNQTWTPVSFYCRPVCPDPPVVADSSIITFNNSINGTADYQCDNETVLIDGPALVMCLQSQNWSLPQFECRRQCAVLDPQPNTEPITVPARTIGTILNYTCITQHDVYPLTETPQIICQQNQQWLISFQCKPVCMEVPSLPNANLTTTDRFVGDIAIYSCINDTVLMNGPAQVECQSNQTWASPTFDCRRQCPEPPTVQHTEPVITDLTIGTIYNYTCITDYQPTTIPQIICQQNQQWSVVQFECRPVCVESPPVVPDGNLTTTDRFVGDVAIYSCINDAVLMNGPAQVECQSNQTWASPTFDCRRQCPEPPTVQHTEPVITDLTIGTIYNYTCITDYQPTTIPQIICQQNQQWSVVQFECRPVCEEAPSVLDANLTNTDRFVGDVAIYSCINDTVLMNGPAQVECHSNQTWVSPTFDCRRQCPEPPLVPNTNPVTGSRVIGSSITFICITGYEETSNTSITCQQDGNWSQISFECQPVCDEPPTILNTTALYNNKFVGSNVTYECDSGLTQSGNPTITCQANITWSSIDFSCD